MTQQSRGGFRAGKPLLRLLADGATLTQRLLAVVPERPAVAWTRQLAASWRPDRFGMRLAPRPAPEPVALDDLLCIDRQKAALEQNTRQFLAGLPANNALLWGARGTGKSSLIHALLNRYGAAGLRVVDVDKEHLAELAELNQQLAAEPYRFVVFCDDLSFDAHDGTYKSLKSLLEGAVGVRADNVLIYATSNRRHLLPEPASDNEAARLVEGELHHADAVEEKISLSDRFGLWLSFYPFPQDAYLSVARHWVDRLSAEHGGALRWNDETRAEALRWALGRGVRSGRTAQHFARHWVGSELLKS